MVRCKVGGAFRIPNGIFWYSNRPNGIVKADIAFALSVNPTCYYPFRRSILNVELDWPTASIGSSLRERE